MIRKARKDKQTMIVEDIKKFTRSIKWARQTETDRQSKER